MSDISNRGENSLHLQVLFHGLHCILLFKKILHAGYNYGEVLYKSIMFFEAQRSGWLPSSKKVTWRGHSATTDQGHLGEDLTGGWYDCKLLIVCVPWT